MRHYYLPRPISSFQGFWDFWGKDIDRGLNMMRIMILAFALFGFLIQPFAMCAEGVALFKNLHYGMTADEVKEITKSTESGQEGVLTEEGVSFAGHKWTGAYSFAEGKLIKVALLSSDNIIDRYVALDQLLNNNGMQMALMIYNSKTIDIFHLLKTEKVEVITERINEAMLEALTASSSFEFDYIPWDPENKAIDIFDFFAKAPNDIRCAAINYLQESGEDIFAVSFQLPLILRDEKKNIPNEKF